MRSYKMAVYMMSGMSIFVMSRCPRLPSRSFSWRAFGLRPAPTRAPPRLVPSLAIKKSLLFEKNTEQKVSAKPVVQGLSTAGPGVLPRLKPRFSAWRQGAEAFWHDFCRFRPPLGPKSGINIAICGRNPLLFCSICRPFRHEFWHDRLCIQL